MELDQTRSHNKANEVGTIGVTVGDNWADPVHDKVGNMTTIPQPGALTSTYACKYDAWNRLIEVKAGSTVIATYAYDGLNRRIKATPGGGTPRHFFYSRDWQVLEERVASDADAADADRQFVWGQRYVDDLILRDQDTSTTPDGVMETQLWDVQDANFNVTAVLDDAGAVLERYTYTPYGVMTAYQPNFSTTITSPTLEYRYAGYRFDAETGLMQVRHRYLHAPLGRLITPDPAYSDANLYRYCGSNPVICVDPSGLLNVDRAGGGYGHCYR